MHCHHPIVQCTHCHSFACSLGEPDYVFCTTRTSNRNQLITINNNTFALTKLTRQVLRQEAKPEEELLGPVGKKQLSATRDVQRQLRDDIIPSTIKELRELSASSK